MPTPLATPKDALAWMARVKVATLTPARQDVPALVTAVATTPVKGSWWAHPDGGRIFALGEALEESGQVLTLKWLEGKVTFVHRSRWPALLRLATDGARVAEGERALSKGAKGLLREVRSRGLLRVEGKARKAAQGELEARLLVVSSSEHGERGRHVTVLRAWEAWAAPKLRREAAALSLEEALAALPPQKRTRPDARSSRGHSAKR